MFCVDSDGTDTTMKRRTFIRIVSLAVLLSACSKKLKLAAIPPGGLPDRFESGVAERKLCMLMKVRL